MNNMRHQGKLISSNHTDILRNVAIACVVLFLMGWAPEAFTQERNEEVTIIAPYQPSISDALKMSFTPNPGTPEREEQQFHFNYIDRQLFAPLTLDPVQPARYTKLREEDLLRNYIKAGFGNYTTPYLEFFAGSLRSEKYQLSARFRHLSSQGKIKDVGPSAYSKNEAEINGKLFTRQHTLEGNVEYQRNVYHFYGFQPDSFPGLEVQQDSIRQRFQNIGASASFKSNYQDAKKFAHAFSLGFYNYTDRFESRENLVSANIELAKGFDLFRRNPPAVIGLAMGMEYFGRKDSLGTSSPLLFNVGPWLDFNFEQYRLRLGFEVATEHDSATKLNFFPVISGEVSIVPDNLKAFAEIKGKREVNSFRSLSRENPFIVSDPELRNSITRFSIGGGLMGNTGGFNFLAKASYRNVKDMPLFVNDSSLVLLNRFEVIYDDVNEFSFEAGGGYDIPGTMHAGLTGIFYGYSMKNEMKAWHKPVFKVTLDGSYTFLEKYTVEAAFFLIGPAYYRDFSAGETVAGKLTTSYDLNAGFNYQHNEHFSAFLKLNNILNQRYDLWYRYPTQGFQAMAGLGFSF